MTYSQTLKQAVTYIPRPYACTNYYAQLFTLAFNISIMQFDRWRLATILKFVDCAKHWYQARGLVFSNSGLRESRVFKRFSGKQ